MFGKIGCLLVLVGLLMVCGCGPKPDNTPATIEKLNAQLKYGFENPIIHYQLGQLYQQIGDWNKSAHEFELAAQFDPVFWDAQASMIKVMRIGGEEEKSAEKATDFVRAASGFPEDSLALGRAFEKENIDDFALRAYEQALKLAPKSAAIYKQLGMYYINRNNPDMAKTYFRQSFELDPYQSDVAGELGKLGIKVQVLPRPAQTAIPASK